MVNFCDLVDMRIICYLNRNVSTGINETKMIAFERIINLTQQIRKDC